jgi:hypothetical protein
VVNGGGLTTATLYKSKVVGGNAYGRTTATAGTDRTASSPNLTLRILFAAVTGITFFDIYVSIDADPKWVGRITEAQRASGIKITAVGVTGAGGTPGGVDVEVPGTGLQSLVSAAENTAYAIPATIVVPAWQKEYVDFDLTLSRTGDAVAPSLTVVPFFKNSLDGTYYLGDHKSLVFGGQSGVLQAMQQRLRVELQGHPVAGLLVAKIAGTGASLSIRYSMG